MIEPGITEPGCNLRGVMRRIAVFRITLCFAILSGLSALGRSAKPNVLFIMADDLNIALSGYGHPECHTPNLDKLAKEGVLFEKAYCQFPICGPSRASIMTGQYPEVNGVVGNAGKVQEDRITLPRLFMNNGYWVGRVGKIYHLGVPGEVMGGIAHSDHAPSWNYVYNLHAMEALTPGKAEDLTGPDSTSKYAEYREIWKKQKPGVKKLMIPGNHQGSDQVVVETADDSTIRADGMTADRAIELLRERAEDKKPFFLGVGFLRPHTPYVAPERDFAQYDYRQLNAPSVEDYAGGDVPVQAKGKDKQSDLVKRKKIRRGYYGSVSYMDRMVGRVLDELDRLGLRDNTIVVFASDHGYLLGEHNRWAKNQLWEEAMRVPLIVSAPGQTQDATCGHYVELVDLYPTLQELAGLPADPGAQGISFTNLLNHPDGDPVREDALVQINSGWCLRRGKWAYMWYPETKKHPEGFMLYDMEKDPKQLTNLAKNPEYVAVKERLHKRLLERRAMVQE